jgi:hypothetical protein
VFEVWSTTFVVSALGVLTFASIMLSNGNVLAAVAPIAVAVTLWGIAKSPIRTTAFLLLFLGLAVDKPGDGADGKWASPFQIVGALLMHNLSNTLPISALHVSGLILMLAVLVVLRVHRVLTGRIVDVRGALPVAPPMKWALALSAVTVLWLVAWGLVNGGSLERAKLQVQVILPLLLMATLLAPSLRPDRDYPILGRIVVAAACCKALMALWIRHVMPAATPDKFGIMREIECATVHGDSLLFAAATFVLFAPLVIQPNRAHLRRFLLLMPLIVAGLVANDRRIAWVEIGIGVMLLIAMNSRSWFTRRLVRGVVLASPVLTVYIVAGFYLPQRVFRPVHTIRSMFEIQNVDGSIDRSTLFRDVENYNLIYTFHQNPVFGRGFGNPFDAPVPNDDMSGFKEYRYLPHNSLLGLMGFAGGLAVIALFAPSVVALFLAARAQRLTRSPVEAMASAVVIGNVAAYIFHVWGDIGFTELTSIFTVGASFAVASQVAVSSGAWRVARPRLEMR